MEVKDKIRMDYSKILEQVVESFNKNNNTSDNTSTDNNNTNEEKL